MTRTSSTLDSIVRALHSAFVEVLVAPAGSDVPIGSVTLVDADDLAAELYTTAAAADLYLLAGVREADAVAWFDDLATRSSDLRPTAVMSKIAAASSLMQHAARTAGVALVAVHTQTRWDRLLSMVRGVLDHSSPSITTPQPSSAEPSELAGLVGADTDLFGLAHTVAVLTRGMVSIEDQRSHVLAYSASDDQADELRTLSILGREGPAEYLRRLEQWGVYDAVRRSDEVVEVPAHSDLGIRRRLVAGIRTTATQDGSGTPRLVGTLWIQEGRRRLTDDAPSVLQGAAAVAARLITRILEAPTNEAVQIQRLLGARGGGVDVPSLAAALSIPTDGPAAVIGLAAVDGAAPDAPSSATMADLSGAIRLHASSFHRLSLVTTLGDRIYVLVPRTRAEASVPSWTRRLLEGIEGRTGIRLRAAVASPVAALSEVAAARREVDRVLDGTAGADDRVTTLADSRTSVLLGEIVDLLLAHPSLHDPRMAALVEYDARTSSSLRESIATYLRHPSDVRRAAADLHVHPNTLRYRVRRAEEITETDLSDPAARLLMELQLAVLARQAST
ncbi:helix-turn-helix domain-containing protein [Rhodococcus sp. BP-241]|uniref:PucR family transcriptional regulator n=1 Tax=Rhodococcus sp. BP-241 TaxID=2739441 RepID=UPI001C9B9F4C|nr:PucR family transcriptional regulator [Rhodococcus sp. BP-241]MBY6707634.1 helix-turn-helix domain-containing protein [Rhodococcus sp. BP-241]